MTAIQNGFHYIHSSDMSYDEIDFEERLGDDDIDIDIDLETGQNDEDYILEDVNSDVSHEEAFIINDDVMIDDENVSYPMDDVETVQEEHIEMQDAELPDSSAIEFNNPELDNNLEGNVPLLSAGADETSETVIKELRSREAPVRHTEAEQISGEQVLLEEILLPDQRTVNVDTTLSPPTSPLQGDSTAHIGADLHIPISNSAYSSSINADLRKEDSTNPAAISENSTTTGRIQDNPEPKVGDSDSTLLSTEKVIVVYRDAEYALCSSSESDDPDTFFLKDVSLVTGSLIDLLAELREVIHEDLGSEDELCLTAEDLGIEINETCMSVHNLNFASVINLHERLQRNDGVQTPGPLYVTLSTKVDFAKRLANLVAGAAAGRGMSDIISGDEESEELEVTDEHAGDLNESANNHENDLTGGDVKAEIVPETVNSEQNTGIEPEGLTALEDHSGEEMPKDHSRLATSDHIPSQTKTSEYSKDGLDDDGDFIDYEDEEYDQGRETSNSADIGSSGKQHGKSSYFITPCSGLASCTCPPCMKHPLIYDEENKSKPDQHSPSPAPDVDGHHVQSDSNAPHHPPIYSDQYYGETASREADNNDGEFSTHQEHGEYEGDEELAQEQTDQEFHVSYDGIHEEAESKDSNIVAEGLASVAEGAFDQPLSTEASYDDLEEIDYNLTGQDSVDTGLTDHLIASTMENQGSKSLAADKHDHDDDEISYEEADIPDSNESERTLIADESAPDFNLDENKKQQQQHNDEINYDTDDQQELRRPSNQKAITEASPVSNGHTGKRQRAYAEDVTDRASKQSKRARP